MPISFKDLERFVGNLSLNKIIRYWMECLKAEDALSQGIPLRSRTRALICPWEHDPFLFLGKNEVFKTKDEKVIALVSSAALQNEEIHYGYPLLFYLDEKSRAPLLAPLLVTKLSHRMENGHALLWKEELVPSLGLQAAQKMGLRLEEISTLNRRIIDLFRGELGAGKNLAEKCLNAILEETKFTIHEPVAPAALANSRPITEAMGPGLYNKSLLYRAESSAFNAHLLRDLAQLMEKKDLEKSGLSFLLNRTPLRPAPLPREQHILLPFSLDEYQASALRSILANPLSVITGPPGTGKSQFISVLLINLFLAGKKVLFVSHTNEAVEVVNRKINEQFKNMVFRTGNKDLRQGLAGCFNELALDSRNAMGAPAISKNGMGTIWKEIIGRREQLLEVNHREQRFHELDELFKVKGSFILKCKRAFYLWRLRRGPKRKDLETAVRSLEQSYVEQSRAFIRKAYAEHIQKLPHTSVRTFLQGLVSLRPHEDLSPNAFVEAFATLRLWSCTLKSLNRTFPLQAGLFDYVIFDEASQVDMPSAAPALYRAQNVVVVGDPMQLPHIAGITKEKDQEIAATLGIDKENPLYKAKIRHCDVSLYRSAESSLAGPPILLAKHYRSQDQIIHLCNQVFYGGQLQISTQLDAQRWPANLPSGLFWDDCAGVTEKPYGGSRVNRPEAETVHGIFRGILEKIQGSNLSVGIVTPYSAQRNEIERLVRKSTTPETLERHDVKIMTAHKFQGSEKDIMIFSAVLAQKGEGNNDRWYNTHPQILNVALSRAKYLLHIVGDRKFCQSRDGYLKKIADGYSQIKEQEDLEKQYFDGNFDSQQELALYQRLQSIDFKAKGYELIPKQIVKRYTLDFALVGKKKIDIECDGFQHSIVDGLPVIEDVERDAYLKKEGWSVLRFPNHQIVTDMDSVLDEILEAI